MESNYALLKYERRLETIDARLARAHLDKYRSGKYDGKSLEHQRLELLQAVSRLIECGDYTPECEQSWLRQIIPGQVEHDKRVAAVCNKIQSCLVKANDDIRAIHDKLAKEHSQNARKGYWKKYMPFVNALVPDVKILIRLRNDKSASLGYQNYADLSCRVNGLSLARVKKSCRAVLQKTDMIYQRRAELLYDSCRLRRACHYDEKFIACRILPPVDLNVKFRAKQMVETLCQRLGWRLNALPVAIRYLDIPYGALSCSIRPRKESVIVMNKNQQKDVLFLIYLFHELGHALHNCLVNELVPYIQIRSQTAAVKEGIADFVGYLALEEEILTRCLGVDKGRAPQVRKHYLDKRSLWLRRQAIDALAEISLYEDGVEKSLRTRDALMSEHNNMHGSSRGAWLLDSIFFSHPMYLYNYILADNVKSRIDNDIHRQKIKPLSKETGRLLQHRYFHCADRAA